MTRVPGRGKRASLATNNVLSNLVYGTSAENSLDIVRHGRNRNAQKTHCDSGHEFTPENTRMEGRSRRCRTCQRDLYHRNKGATA